MIELEIINLTDRKLLERILNMSQTLEDQVLNMISTLNTVATAVGSIQAPTVDFTPVTTAINAGFATMSTKLDAIAAQFQASQAATPAPTATPATPAATGTVTA